MASCMVVETREETSVGMGQIAAGRGSARLQAVLGSCIGVVLHHPRHDVGALGHVVLPDSGGRSAAPGKFADTAIPEMVRSMKELGVPSAGVVAKIAGGASMFGRTGPMQIGEANARAVVQALNRAGIRIVGEDIGGNSGRRVTLNCADGKLKIETIGNPPKFL